MLFFTLFPPDQARIPKESYINSLQPIRTHFSLLLVVVDLSEAPCNIHPDLMEVISEYIMSGIFCPRKIFSTSIWNDFITLFHDLCLVTCEQLIYNFKFLNSSFY